MRRYILPLILLVFSTFSFMAGSVYADPPGRVGRISYLQGTVSFYSAHGKNKSWVLAQLNRPLVTGDRLWAADRARAELQLGNAALRVEDKTSLRILNLNDRIAQFDLSQGTLSLSVRSIGKGQLYEIDTPQLAFKVTQAGSFRFDVSDNGLETYITVHSGKGTVYTRSGSYKIKLPGTYHYANRDFQHIKYYDEDDFDRWSYKRELRAKHSGSARYVSAALIGYEDLDSYGTWRYVRDYGYVWVPARVSSGWAPYRHGHWAWVDPWGWTWIADEPWGFATSHYGRWVYYHGSWMWVPGRKAVEATYAPALVAFVGGNNFNISVSVGGQSPGVAWFPLGPQDVYVPPYKVSKQYFNTININNTTIHQTNITNVYNNPRPVYVYQTPQAVTAVSKQAFVESKPVSTSVVPVPPAVINQAPSGSTAISIPPPVTSAPPSTTAAKPSETTIERVPVVVTPPSTTIDAAAPPSTTAPVTPVIQVTLPVEAVIPDAAPKPQTTVEKPVDAAPPSEQAAPVSASEVVVPAPAPVIDQAKLDADKQAAAQADAQAAQVAADKAAAEQAAETAKADAAKEAAARVEAENAAAQADAAKAEAERVAADKAEADRVAAAQAEQERAAAAQAEADRAAAAQAEQDRAPAAQAEADRAAAAQAEQERAAAAAAQTAPAEAVPPATTAQ